ncbi:hypothetical protein ACOMHN_066966 [Nucella lapillus]
MTGCPPPHDSSHQPPPPFYTLATGPHPQGTPPSGQSGDRPQTTSGPYPAHPQPDTPYLTQQGPYTAYQQLARPAEHAGVPYGYCPSPVGTRGPESAQHETSPFLHRVRPDHVPQATLASVAQSVGQHHGQPFRTAVSQYSPAPHHHHQLQYRSPEQQRYRGTLEARSSVSRPVEQQRYMPPGGVLETQSSVSRPSEQWAQSTQPCPLQSGRSPPPHTAAPFYPSGSPAGYPHTSPGLTVSTQQTSASQQDHQVVTSAGLQQSYPGLPSASPSAVRDKKPSLQIMTEHSPSSSGSGASPPQLVHCEGLTYPPSSQLASDAGGSPYTLPVKQESQWEGATPPRFSPMDSPMVQVHRERLHMSTGGSETGELLGDSETGSSVLEDSSSSSREQSPFSTMTRNLSLHSPEQSPSPLARKSPDTAMVASHDEDLGEEREGSEEVSASSLSCESEFHPSKFKRRLHERYMLSLKDSSEIPQKIKEESLEGYERCEMKPFPAQLMPKLERSDSDSYFLTHSPSRSSSDTDRAHTEHTEIGTTSADEGDVFMEPTPEERTKSKPPSLHQREPLDLSRAHPYPSFRSSSGSSPLLDPEHLSPASKMYSPVFRSPHRLSYSPHGLMSPQSQSPLCSVPEGGRIFNFNMPSVEGAHSDSDLISPSPVSPRVFTFPPHSSLLNPSTEINRLALSPRVPYTPPPSFMRGKPFTSGLAHGSKWGDEPDFYSKRSLSESDMTYLCPMCGHVFASNDSLAKHIAKHLPSETVRTGDTKIHYCKVCNRSFSRSDMLTRHMRLHTGLKPYECFDCGQVFSRSDHLNTHRRTHTGEKPYRCPHCPYAACRRDMITRHMRTHVKRTSRRSRYLSVPDEGDAYKPSGSVSSTERTDSQDFSVSGHASISSVESVESELIHSSHPPQYLGTSVDSLLSPEQDRSSIGSHPSPCAFKMSDDAQEREGGREVVFPDDRFMRYRKGRNWSTTSVESENSEEAGVIREVFVDDAFLDTDPQLSRPRQGDRNEEEGAQGSTATPSPSDLVGVETQNLQKCFISSEAAGKNSS